MEYKFSNLANGLKASEIRELLKLTKPSQKLFRLPAVFRLRNYSSGRIKEGRH